MTTQPEALRLANELEGDYDPDWLYEQGVDEIAAELRRLHESNTELLAALKMLLSYTKACEGVLNCKPAGQIGIAEAAITKAERTTT